MAICDPTNFSRIDADSNLRPFDLPEGVPPLNAFYLYLSSSCNLACRHCWITPHYIAGKPDPGNVINVEDLEMAVHEAKPLGLSCAKLTGGEPMIHPRFIEILDLLTHEGLGLTMETNGTLITAENARYFKQNTNLSFISISIDGATPQSHDRFRNVQGAFEAALRGLDHLVTAGYQNVQVIMCPHHGNVDEVEAVVQIAIEHGAGSIKFNPVTNIGRGQVMHKQGETFDFEEHLRFAHYVRGELQDHTPIPVVINIPPALTPTRELWRTHGDTGDCGVRSILGLLGTGEIALCGIGRTIPELIYGQLGRDSIRDIWLNHPIIRQLRHGLENYRTFPGICGECVHAKTCLTECVVSNYIYSGLLISPSPLCAEAAQRGVFPANRQLSSVSSMRRRQ